MSLVCPACGAAYADDERFCRACGVPLVVEGGPREEVSDERRDRLRRVKPQYAEGELVRVAIGRQLPEAELIQNLLLDEGVPSTLRRTRGFDVPEMLAAGPRDVLVPQSGVATAREVLLQDPALRSSLAGSPGPGPREIAIGITVALAVLLVLALLVV